MNNLNLKLAKIDEWGCFRFLRGACGALVIKGKGWDKISKIAGRKGEQVKLKISAIPWFSLNFSPFYYPANEKAHKASHLYGVLMR